jgi:predicted AlkP superfamily phosphohydrolase/phosphomutase
MMGMWNKMKLLIIGLDGLDYELFKETRPKGYRIKKTLSSFPWTLPGWSSIYTGKPWTYLPVELSTWEYFFQEGGFNIVTDKVFWEIMNEYGLSVELMNLPVTYPPRPVDKYIVCGFPVEDIRKADDYTYPAEMINKLPPYFLSRSDIVYMGPGLNAEQWIRYLRGFSIKEITQYIKEDTELILDTFIDFHDPEVDLAFVQFSHIDRLGHISAKKLLPFAYELTNDIINKLEDNIEADNILLIGDHGLQYSEKDGYGRHQYYTAFSWKGYELRPVDNLTKVAHSILALWNIYLFNIEVSE